MNHTIKPQLSEGADYSNILSEFNTVWTNVVPITSTAASLGPRRNSGLGLTGCARLVETMHGSLTIESRLDKGTTVTISFPIRSLKNFIR